MAVAVRQITQLTRELLNDFTGVKYPDVTLFPFVQMASRELSRRLSLNGLKVTKEMSAAFTITANVVNPTLTLTDIPDLVEPLEVRERLSGTNDDYIQMTESEWETDSIVLGPSLIFWTWRDLQIIFPGSTTTRQVKVRYKKSIVIPTDVSSTIDIIDCLDYLAAATGALAVIAVTKGMDKERAKSLDSMAVAFLDTILSSGVTNSQGTPARRRSFSSSLRGRWSR